MVERVQVGLEVRFFSEGTHEGQLRGVVLVEVVSELRKVTAWGRGYRL